MKYQRSYDGKKIGLLGGSFDPIHNGHIRIAENAYQEFQLDEVWFIPAGHSPNKAEEDMTPASIRMQMVSIAIENAPYFRVSDIELRSAETSYTYRTMQKLHQQFPDSQFYFIMGADSLDYFENWKHPEIICRYAAILAAVRDSMNLTQITSKISQLKSLFPADIFPLHYKKIPVSSTQLRGMANRHELDSSFLPQKVIDYINQNHLYGS